MTTKVRIEHAGNEGLVLVEIWDRSVPGKPDVLAESHLLYGPARQCEVYVNQNRYVVIGEEVPGWGPV